MIVLVSSVVLEPPQVLAAEVSLLGDHPLLQVSVAYSAWSQLERQLERQEIM